jgi:diadenosine tetraphosphate (Ap4A) HIT family hydrolase
VCQAIVKLDHPVLHTDRWVVDLGSNAAYFGRAYVTLRRHETSLVALDATDWQDFREIVRVLELAYGDLFGAGPVNWACLMNNAFRDGGADPHVHWHVFPRYRKPVVFDGQTFTDQRYGEHYDPDAVVEIDSATLDRLAVTLRDHIDGPHGSHPD